MVEETVSQKIEKDSIEKLETIFQYIIKSMNPEIMSVSGDWGTGKTFTWKYSFKELLDKAEIGFSNYSYVSLFGLDSIPSFKEALLYNLKEYEAVLKRKEIKCQEKTLKRNYLVSLTKVLKNIKIPYINSNINISSELLFNAFPEKSLICIDDLERRGAFLNLKDIFGLLLQLKEVKDCKIVLLFNYQMFDDDDKKILQEQTEKVIDCEYHHVLSSDECIEIGFKRSQKAYANLKDYLKILGINNIRFVQKLLINIDKLPFLFDNSIHEKIKDQAFRSLALYFCSKYFPEGKFPTLSYIETYNRLHTLLNGNKSDNAGAANWESLLANYEYGYTDDFDLLLLDYINKGSIPEQALTNLIAKKNQQYKEESNISDYLKTYDRITSSFIDQPTGDNLIEELINKFRKYFSYLSINQLTEFYYLLKSFNIETIDTFVNDYFEIIDPDAINLDVLSIIGDRNSGYPPIIIDNLKKMKTAQIKKKSLEQVLRKVSNSSGWDQEDEEILANASPEQFKELFKSSDGDTLRKYLHSCLQFGRFSSPTERMKKIESNAIEALRLIAGENKYNKYIVKSLSGLGFD